MNTAGINPKILIWRDLPQDIFYNMAVDETLLNFSRLFTGCAMFLRFYSWARKCVSFGYAQSYDKVFSDNPGLPLVRRPTGGGVVCHGDDFTYAAVIPAESLFFGLPLREFYVLLHSFVGEALKKNGFLPDIEKKEKKVSGYYKCFENPVSGDLFLPETGKIAGAAQKRINNGILIQGSVAIGRLGIDFAKFADAFAEVLAAKGDFAVEKYSPPVEIRAHALKLCEKYSSSDWNEKRKYERL